MHTSMAKVLARLERRSNLEKTHRMPIPVDERMLAITRETGELINMLLYVIKAENVLEVGTSTGYSTLWCADIIKRNSGRILTIEKNQEKINRAKKNFADARVSGTIKIVKGMASDVLGRLSTEQQYRDHFDFALIDADKENVIEYFDLILPLVRSGGIIMTDNMLHPKKYQRQMRKLTLHIKKNPQVRTITCPVGNGEEISVKA